MCAELYVGPDLRLSFVHLTTDVMVEMSWFLEHSWLVSCLCSCTCVPWAGTIIFLVQWNNVCGSWLENPPFMHIITVTHLLSYKKQLSLSHWSFWTKVKDSSHHYWSSEARRHKCGLTWPWSQKMMLNYCNFHFVHLVSRYLTSFYPEDNMLTRSHFQAFCKLLLCTAPGFITAPSPNKISRQWHIRNCSCQIHFENGNSKWRKSNTDQ